MKHVVGVLVLGAMAAGAYADFNYWDLSSSDFSQDWTNTSLIAANDDWSGVPSIAGYLGDDPSGSTTGVDPQTILGDLTTGATLDVIANQTNPNTLTSGGVAEFQIADATVALQGSGTADRPFLRLMMNATGRTNIIISYTVRDIDGSADNSIQPVALHYRIGSSGSWTNVASAFVADGTTGPSAATLVTPVFATDAAWDNQPNLEFRIMTTNAVGSDEWVGIDNIAVRTTAVPEPASLAVLALGGLRLRLRKRRSR